MNSWWWWRLARGLRLIRAQIWAGLVVQGGMTGLVPPEYVLELVADARRVSCGPPAGHPERLVPERPLTPEESGLWRQLVSLDRLVR